MPEVYRRCSGMDVHKETVVVCVLPPDGKPGLPVRKTFGTFRNDLTRMRGWLKQLKVTEIAMESTGVYWRPIWNVLEEQGFERLLLVNPVQVKALAGRKSDGRDCQRIAEFLEDRRLDPSFVPPAEIRQLRQLLRHRLALLHQRNQVHNQIRDLFETANLKLSSVLSDLLGLSGRRIIEAMIAGEESADRLSWKLRGSARRKEKMVKESLKGCFNDFHRKVLGSYYRQYQFLTSEIGLLEQELKERMAPHAEKIDLLCTIPGVDQVVAWNLIAELGSDMDVFPSADHCASWAGLTPGENESAGKQQSTRCRKGNKYLRRVLAQAAWATSRCKKGYLRALFFPIKARRGWAKAIVAVAHKILVIAWSMLKNRTPYTELGEDYFDRLHADRTIQRLVTRLERLGQNVSLTPTTQNAKP
jgi:transposase